MSRIFPALLIALGLWASPAPAAELLSAHPTHPQGRAALRVTLTVPGSAIKTGDRTTITATVSNLTGLPLDGVTLLLGLVNLTPGHPEPLGLETWTTDPESVALPPLAPGASASAVWHLVMIQPGPLGVYASAMAGPRDGIESSPVTVLPVRDVRALNPGNALPVAVGEPLVLLGLMVVVRLVPRAARSDS